MSSTKPQQADSSNVVRDRSTGRLVVAKLERADTWLKRFKGLMGRETLDEDSGLYLEPCRQVHCFFMKFPIDVVFVDEQGRVVGLDVQLRPWRIGRYHPRAVGALELPAGSVERLEIQKDVSVLDGLTGPLSTDQPSTNVKAKNGQGASKSAGPADSQESADDRQQRPKPQCFH